MGEIIKVSHLKKYFKDNKAVNDISFSVERGELFGFLGENGAGKTTTIHMLCTMLLPTEGEVVIDGFLLGKDNEQIKRHIGVVYQENCLDDILTVKQNLLLRGGLYETNQRKLVEQMEKLCEILDIKDFINQKYGKLSGGQKRRCEIARALMHTPELLFLDEPTTGLDPASRRSVWETIYKLQRELNMTVFLTTHYMEEAARANHIGIMKKGQLVEYKTPFELKEAYAKDKLILIPRPDKRQELMRMLIQQQLPYQIKDNEMLVMIDTTLLAIPIIENLQEMLCGFEVIQGSMDDVFLNVIQKEEGISNDR
ncbi:MAG: ABC transporter ATP-binding protein [Lachnospiraceae bacterium]|nr:ABC transporter ATP-binding protein [Lachnospiraceae bacterium]